MLRILILLAGFTQALGTPDLLSWVKEESQLCSSPDRLPYLYSGIRAYQVLMLDWPVRHFWYLVRCSQGTIVEQQFFPTNRTTNFKFGEPLCFSKNDCYIIARRRKYAQRLSPIYRPFATVGAIYKYDAGTNLTSVLSVMKSDNAANVFTLTSGFYAKMRFTPLLYSPSAFMGISGTAQLDVSPFENYVYTTEDSYQPWWKVNELVNKLVATARIDDKLVFWEFDALQRHLCNEMGWRDRVNKVISS